MKAEGFASSFARANRRFRANIKEETGHQTGKEPAKFDKSEEEMIERWRKHESTAARLSVAEEIRNLIHTSSSHGVLSTNSLQYPGYPVGSVVAFVLDEDGLPFFSLSTMSAHTRELLADNRASLVVMAYDFKSIAEGRISILGTISKVLDEASKSKLRERYLERHKDSYWIDFGDFSFFKMTNVEMVRYVGGFARAGSATGAEFLAAKVDPLIGFATPVMKHMNDDHADSLITMVQHYVGVPVSQASMVALDRLGFTVISECMSCRNFNH
jgi:putative heme iron utilization protein